MSFNREVEATGVLSAPVRKNGMTIRASVIDTLRWCLLRLVDKATAAGIDATRLRHNGRLKAANEPLPPLFSRGLVKVVGRAMDEGRVLVWRAATLLGLMVDDLAELFDDHGLTAPVSERPDHDDARARPDGGRTRRSPVTGCNKS